MILDIARQARAASKTLALASTEKRSQVLMLLSDELIAKSRAILAANAVDVNDARTAGLSEAMIDRLLLDEKRLQNLAQDLRKLVQLPDPIGQKFDEQTLPNGLRLYKQRVPLGVIGVIYESRPNVTMDVAGLSIKTGNAAILRGGSETINSNRVLVQVIQSALSAGGLPAASIQFIDSPDRGLILELLKMHDYIDIIIPRGGGKLHTFCRENSQIPVITGGMGICHLYVDSSADLEASLPVIFNARVQRPSACNSLDTLLVHSSTAALFLPQVVKFLTPAGVTFRADERALACLKNFSPGLVQLAGPDDFDTEWLSLILGLKVVDSLDEAMEHIRVHSLDHSDGILTGDAANAARFVNEVDSAAVYVNASTRFTDGGQFGLGAEVAVSTQRLHARGPMGLTELTIYKWVGEGSYTCRE